MTLFELFQNPHAHFAGLSIAERVRAVCVAALRGGQRIVAVQLPLDQYVRVEQYAVGYPQCFTWSRDDITWRTLGGELKVSMSPYVVGPCVFQVDDGETNVRIDLSVAG